nr:immunoglobulin heavy chain junction region [Mus musculus]
CAREGLISWFAYW